MELKELKENYKVLEKKYKLPKFKDANNFFEIDRIENESDNLLRDVRKVMMEKVVNYIRFLEMMVYPMQAPPMFSFLIKEMTPEEKKNVESLYSSLVELEVFALKLEVEYVEKNEAEAIKKIHKTWSGLKDNLLSVFALMEKNWKKSSEKKEKSYFG